ncbi:MAG: epimerase, partial [Geodermatophilales bacterium]|nr:epimerase [Geodermatophilales bacterium]
AVRHQFDQEYVIDATATTELLGLTATPWDEVIAATVGTLPVTG